MSICETTYEGQPAIAYETDRLALTILPHIGGKVISVLDRATGRELLWREPDRPLRKPPYGAAYEQSDISGWDECFPSIGACPYPLEPWAGVGVPDHGELWTAVWSVEQDRQDLVMRATGVALPYVFERRFRPLPAGLRIEYAATNRGHAPLAVLWSMHPFFSVNPTTRILLPDGVRVRVELSKNERLGAKGSLHPWPGTHDRTGASVDLSMMGKADQNTLEKLYTDRLRAGWAAAQDEATGDYLAFTFDCTSVPFIGMAINRGGWPFDGPRSDNLILEPCTGWPDRLDEAVEEGTCVTILSGDTARWQIDLHVGSGGWANRSA